LADASPLPEREIAWRAGIGLRGRNGLLILPPYGSYSFLGTVLTDAPLDCFSIPPRDPAPDCIGCGQCVAHCPGGALDTMDFSRCLSHLTQKKGDLSSDERALIAAHPLIWGCDLCQSVCPYNKDPELSPLDAFRADLIDTLCTEDLEGLTNRTFRTRYAARAFTWRGPAVLRRNLKIQSGDA